MIFCQFNQPQIKDPDALWLIRVIIDGNPTDTGLGIGALTSQLFANIYLDHLDHYAKEVLRIKNYIRYMDDIVILHASKGYLHNIRKEMEDFLWQELRLKTNGKTQVMAVNRGITFLGFRIWPSHRLLKSQAKRRIKMKLRLFAKLYKEKRIGLEEINASIQSWLGHLKHCDGCGCGRSCLRVCAITLTDGLCNLPVKQWCSPEVVQEF